MRKLILITALLLASASAHAGEIKGLGLAANDTSAATDAAQPLPPISASEAPKQQAAEPARPQASGQQAARLQAKRIQARRLEGDEAKARRIAAKYGISW